MYMLFTIFKVKDMSKNANLPGILTMLAVDTACSTPLQENAASKSYICIQQ